MGGGFTFQVGWQDLRGSEFLRIDLSKSHQSLDIDWSIVHLRPEGNMTHISNCLLSIYPWMPNSPFKTTCSSTGFGSPSHILVNSHFIHLLIILDSSLSFSLLIHSVRIVCGPSFKIYPKLNPFSVIPSTSSFLDYFNSFQTVLPVSAFVQGISHVTWIKPMLPGFTSSVPFCPPKPSLPHLIPHSSTHFVPAMLTASLFLGHTRCDP